GNCADHWLGGNVPQIDDRQPTVAENGAQPLPDAPCPRSTVIGPTVLQATAHRLASLNVARTECPDGSRNAAHGSGPGGGLAIRTLPLRPRLGRLEVQNSCGPG